MARCEAFLERVRGAFADYDSFSLGLLLVRRVARALGIGLSIHTYALVAQPVRPVAVPERKRKQYRTRFLDPHATELAGLPRPRAAIDRRFAQGARCLGLFREDRLIGCAWICRGGYFEDEVRCRFEPTPASLTAWDFDIYLDDAYRLGFAFSTLWSAVNDWLAAEGVQWTMSRISTLNPASVRAHARLGARRLGRAVFFTLGRGQLMLSSISPYVHVGRAPASMPRLLLPAPAPRPDPAS